MAHLKSPPSPSDSLVEAALKVLHQADPWLKAEYTNTAVHLWRSGELATVAPAGAPPPIPSRPARSDDKVKLLPPGAMPKRGRGGTLASRQALLHSLVHIESWAVDLAWDVIARFGADPAYSGALPRQFFDDFVAVAEDECRHFSLLCRRLEQVGSHYGALPAHDGLWLTAQETAYSLPARLALEHCVHEARGLDVLPSTLARFAAGGDAETAALLRDVVYEEEVSHCAAGVRWLRHLYDRAHSFGRLGGRQSQPEQPQQPERQSNQRQLEQQPQQQQQQPQVGSPGAAQDDAGELLGRLVLGQAEQGVQGDQRVKGQEGDRPLEQQQQEGASGCPGAHGRSAGAGGDGCGSGGSGGGGDGDAGSSGGGGGAYDWVADALQYSCVEHWFHGLVRAHFKGHLKPPFNVEARTKAGFAPNWYLPLVGPIADLAGGSATHGAAAGAIGGAAAEVASAAGAIDGPAAEVASAAGAIGGAAAEMASAADAAQLSAEAAAVTT